MPEPRLVAQLRDRQTAIDKAGHEALAAELLTHPSISTIIPAVSRTVAAGPCSGTGCPDPGVAVFDKATLLPVLLCRDCINAIRMDSLAHDKHPAPGALCVKCDIKYDIYGFVIGALHHYVSIEDEIITSTDGPPQVLPGIRSRIALNKITLAPDGTVTLPDF